VKLLGVYDFVENTFDEERPMPQFAVQAAPKAARGMPGPEPSLGMDIQHSKTVTVSVDIWYRVSAF
jgi:hypothetical protein